MNEWCYREPALSRVPRWHSARTVIRRRSSEVFLWLMLFCCLLISSSAIGQEQKAETAVKPDSTASAATPAKEQHETPTLALVGAQICTLGGQGVIDSGVVLLTGDKISKVGGRDLEVPAGVETLDVAGMVLTPGLIDASSRLWLTTAAANSTASDASLNVLDGIDIYSDQWHEVVRHGITTVYVQPGRGGTLGGYGAVLSTVPGDAGPTVLSKYAALQASIGIGAANNRVRSQQFESTKKAFTEAAAYQKKWDEYNEYLKKKEEEEKKAADAKSKESPSTTTPGTKAKEPDAEKPQPSDPRPSSAFRRGRPGGTETGGPVTGGPVTGKPTPQPEQKDPEQKDAEKGAEKKDTAKEGEKPEAKPGETAKEKPPTKPKQDDAKERLAKVVNGQIPLRLEIHTADDAHYAHELLKEFTKLQVVFAGVSELRSSTEGVRKLMAPIVLGPWLSAESNYRDDPDSKRVWPRAFHGYDGALVIASAGTTDRSSRLLRAHVGQAIASGIDAETALLAVTLNAARALGVDDQLGSVEAGKRADLVCFRGHPTDSSAKVALVVVAGKVVHHTKSTDESKTEKPKLVETKEQVVASRVSGDAVELKAAELNAVEASTIAIRTKNYLQPDGTTSPQTVVIDTEQGTVVSLDAIDAKVELGVQVVDVGSAWVTPGLFSSHATLGLSRLVDPQLSDATYIDAADAITAGFEGENKLVREGMLRALLSPGDANTLAGRSSVIRLGAKNQVLVREATMKFTLTSSARSTERFPSSLAGQLQLVKESLGGQLLDTRLYLPEVVQERLAKQRVDKLTSVASGKTWTLLAVSSDADIRAALDLVEHQKLKAALLGAVQLEPFLERIKALNLSVIARPANVSDYNWYPQDLATASHAGIDVYFAGETAEQLRLTAAMATEAGMAPASALSGLCYGPDELLSKDSKAADFVVWSASPLDLGAKPLCVIVDGKVVLGDKVVSKDLEQRGTDANYVDTTTLADRLLAVRNELFRDSAGRLPDADQGQAYLHG